VSEPSEVLILGGGPAGLAVAWGLEPLGRPYRILEAGPVHGGNARTLRHGKFRYDTGPHRFHDRDPVATRRVIELLGDDLREVGAPSRILWHGRFVDFPLRPIEALTSGSFARTLRAGGDFLRSRIGPDRARAARDFESWAQARFGRTVAESFLIPFSEKLWGLPASELSPDVAGRRLPGFRLVDVLKEALWGAERSPHLEGRFLYPRLGYGQIVDGIAASLTPGRIRCGARVVRVRSAGERIAAVEYEVGGRPRAVPTPAVVNTLPVTLLVRLLEPAPPPAVLAAARRLRFRQVVLVTLFLDQESVSDAACTYFPDPALEFTRAHEPRNRSREMSPPGKTSLVVEFPCFETDSVWTRDERLLTADLVRRLEDTGLIRATRVEASAVTRLRNAYPVYSRDYETLCEVVLGHVRSFENLQTLGRGGGFFYGHVHDFIAQGFAAAEAADKYLIGAGCAPGPPG
jgi:protoporphyrinogen oxidase